MDLRRRLLLRGALHEAAAGDLPAPIRPPWSVADERAFVARCTRCASCVAACPHGLITAGDGGYPVLGFARRGCDLCGACLRACPTGALSPSEAGEPLRVRVQIDAGCLAHRRVECRICAESCAARALRFDPVPGNVAQPRVDAGACSGCGDCVSACPVGAITARRAPAGRPAT